MQLSPLEKRIGEIVKPVVTDMGFHLVTVSINGHTESRNLTIMVEGSQDHREVSVDDCARISRQIGSVLDIEDPIRSAYRLEVSTPGMDRPLINESDFVKYQDHLARIETLTPIEGQKRFKGHIRKSDSTGVTLEDDNSSHSIEYNNIKKANLVITEDMIRQDLKKSKKL